MAARVRPACPLLCAGAVHGTTRSARRTSASHRHDGPTRGVGWLRPFSGGVRSQRLEQQENGGGQIGTARHMVMIGAYLLVRQMPNNSIQTEQS